MDARKRLRSAAACGDRGQAGGHEVYRPPLQRRRRSRGKNGPAKPPRPPQEAAAQPYGGQKALMRRKSQPDKRKPPLRPVGAVSGSVLIPVVPDVLDVVVQWASPLWEQLKTLGKSSVSIFTPILKLLCHSFVYHCSNDWIKHNTSFREEQGELSIPLLCHANQFVKTRSLCPCFLHGCLCGNLSHFPRAIDLIPICRKLQRGTS